MAKYDGLIIPRSYNDYINKSDPAGVSQALQLTGVMDAAPTAASTKPAKSGGIFAANAVIMASSATLTGVAISAGSVVRVLFTAALTGSDATTGLTLTYNGNAYAVKVGKDGALANFNAHEVGSGVFKYLQAYTTLELMFDGTQFIIIGNPVVLSSADYTIYPDGSVAYKRQYQEYIAVAQNLSRTLPITIGAGRRAIISAFGYWNNGVCTSVKIKKANENVYIAGNSQSENNTIPALSTTAVLTEGDYEIEYIWNVPNNQFGFYLLLL